MIKNYLSEVRAILVLTVLVILGGIGYGQTLMPPELSNNTIKE